MRNITLNKEDFLDKHPRIFAQLVWEHGQCVVTVHEEKDDVLVVTGAGNMNFIEIPKTAIKD